MNLLNLFRKPKPPAPIILTPFGPVTEAARYTAAMNMRVDADLREKVLACLAKELGSIAKAEIEMRRRYPEVFEPIDGH